MLEPITEFESVDEKLAFSLKSKMGCLILAGGQASRMGIDCPKGVLPVTLVKQKSLFQVFLEKAKAAALRENAPLHIAIMTSPLNHQQTYDFLKKHLFFGFPEEQISFFQQTMLPFEDRKGHPLPMSGPDGNGNALKRFYEAGIWDKWHALGIECVNVIPVDNPLADPFDAKVAFKGEDVIIKAILRRSTEEKVGVLVKERGKVKVLEYTELPPEVKMDTTRFSFANSGLYCFSMSFIERVHATSITLHRQEKTVKFQGNLLEIYKYENFIFDLIPYASKVKILFCSREQIFAPLKNLEGEASPQEVHKALLQSDFNVFAQISGTLPNRKRIFELDPQFYYPTQELINLWKGRTLPPESYINPAI